MGYVTFGTYTVGTDPSGLEPRIMIVTSIGAAAIDVTTTYVAQDGNSSEVTTTVTVIPENSQSGSWIKLILNADDTEVRDVTGITVIGGTNGDKFQIVGLIPGRTLGYIKKVWDSFSPEPLTGSAITGKTHEIKNSHWHNWVSEPLSGIIDNSGTFLLQHGLYGNVLSGYLRLPGGLLITSGFRIIFKDSSSGFAVWGKCYPNGTYNVVLDLQRYDRTLLLLGNEAIDLYDQYGSFYADGYVNQNTSKDIYFIPHSNDLHILGFKKRLWP